MTVSGGWPRATRLAPMTVPVRPVPTVAVDDHPLPRLDAAQDGGDGRGDDAAFAFGIRRGKPPALRMNVEWARARRAPSARRRAPFPSRLLRWRRVSAPAPGGLSCGARPVSALTSPALFSEAAGLRACCSAALPARAWFASATLTFAHFPLLSCQAYGARRSVGFIHPLHQQIVPVHTRDAERVALPRVALLDVNRAHGLKLVEYFAKLVPRHEFEDLLGL